MNQTDRVTLAVLLLAATALLADFASGAGLGGPLYAVATAVALCQPGPRRALWAAVLCSVLAVAGLGGAVLWQFNLLSWPLAVSRLVVLAAVWLVFLAGKWVAAVHAELARTRADLEQLRLSSASQVGQAQEQVGQAQRQLGQAREQVEHAQEQLGQAQRQLGQAKQQLKTTADTRQRIEQAVVDSEAQYAVLVENLALHVIRKDLKGRFTYVSPSFCRLVGRSLEDIRGKTDLELFPKDLATKYRQDDRRVLEELRKFEDIEVVRRPDGGNMYVQVIKSPIYDGQGNPIGVQGLFWDVTDQKRAEAELRESEARKRAIFEAALDCIVFIDQDGRIVEFNRAAEATLGYTRREVVGREMIEVFVPEELRERQRANLSRYAGAGEMGSMLGRNVETQMVGKNGEVFAAEMAVQPIPLQGSAGFAVFVRDITKRKEAEEALRQAAEAAEAASRSKGAFLANMSHEIRTPMNAIIGMTEYLLSTSVTAEQQEYLEMVLDSGNSLMALLNDILDLSKIEAGRMELEAVAFPLRPWLRDSLNSLAFRARQKNLELVWDAAPDAPDNVVGDPLRLRQVLVNLVSNAVKFAEIGKITVAMAPERIVADQVVLRFTVQDTGIGIEPHKCARIFEDFEQADNSTTRRFGGTGLGLSICKRLVEMMHGTIGVTSEVGRGSTFRFTAELRVGSAAVPVAGDRAPATDERPPAAGDAVRRLRILLAEDSVVNQKLAQGLLRRHGHAVVVAHNGREAVERFRAEPFDLVLMDVQMPEMDGYEATRAIRDLEQGRRHTPIIAMTAHAMKGDREQCLAAGMDSYVAKPIHAQDLYLAIERAMR